MEYTQKEIVSDVLQVSATDFSGASVESDEPPTKKIRECAPKRKHCSVHEFLKLLRRI